jgi:hypothetical protein
MSARKGRIEEENNAVGRILMQGLRRRPRISERMSWVANVLQMADLEPCYRGYHSGKHNKLPQPNIINSGQYFGNS